MQNLIILHESKKVEHTSENGLFRFSISNEPMAGVIFDGLSRTIGSRSKNDVICAVPEKWDIKQKTAGLRTVSYTEGVPICRELVPKNKQASWLAVSDGRFVTQVNDNLLKTILSAVEADMVAITVKPELLAYHEKVRLTSQGKVAGFRRLYVDCAEPQPFLIEPPHHVFVRTALYDRLSANLMVPQFFSSLLKSRHSNDMQYAIFAVAGYAWDLETEEGLLNFCRASLRFSNAAYSNGRIVKNDQGLIAAGVGQSEHLVLCGKAMVGEDVKIGPNVVIIGPSIIGSNVSIEQDAVVNSSIIGPNCVVPQGRHVSNEIIRVSKCGGKGQVLSAGGSAKRIHFDNADVFSQRVRWMPFRQYPRFSYAGCFKRSFDIIISALVVLMFVPVFPIIILVIKLTSRGPVFFKDSRQGLHGKIFKCLKFRTMLIGSDELQSRLRTLSDIDGPQFKMADDPRISPVGEFLRETYIDELPQFFNVLCGQMSIVGPRPSPESENTLCPFWRDGRLSVRPGITGLWQICRTREPMKDFQEWIHYDIKYVRNLSLKLDLWIFWQTTKRMLRNFAKQF